MEDLAFERPVGTSPKERHYVRFCGQNRTVVTATVLSTRAREREAVAQLNQNVHGRFLRLDRISPYHLGGLIYAASEISNCGMRIVDISMARAASAGILGGNRFHQRADFVHALRELR
jgi:hypothetical protein